MRTLFDKILRGAIKFFMLTGVTFLVTACYAPAPEPEMYGEDYQQDQEQLDRRLRQSCTSDESDESVR